MSSNKKIKTKKSNTSSSNPQKVPSLKKKKKYIRRRKTKTRTKTKPHKYVSLREVELLESSISQDSKEKMKKDDQDNNHQLDLFPLHPQNLIEEKEYQDHQDNMVDFFNNTYGGETLNSLLWGGDNNNNSTHDEKCSSNHQEDSYLSPSITYRHDGEGGESSDLMKSALRHREREKDGNEDHEEEKEEKWVSYEEVLVIENNKKKKKKESMEEEVMSGSRLFNSQDHQKQSMKRVLSLKLDYEEVMNAWSDKGSFYINGGGGGDHFSSQFQIVPDILHLHDNVRGDSSGGSSLWRVPSSEEGSCSTAGMDAVDGASAGGGDVHDEYGEGMTTMMKMVEREARVLRYKEKRQSRLFSKRIRYQVRKLNAEKRPRLKGRFVKRD